MEIVTPRVLREAAALYDSYGWIRHQMTDTHLRARFQFSPENCAFCMMGAVLYSAGLLGNPADTRYDKAVQEMNSLSYSLFGYRLWEENDRRTRDIRHAQQKLLALADLAEK